MTLAESVPAKEAATLDGLPSAELTMRDADRLAECGAFGEAARLYEKLYDRWPGDQIAIRIAFCYWCLGDADSACAALNRATHVPSDLHRTGLALADLLFAKGDTAQAIEFYRTAASCQRLSAQHHVNLEYLYREIGDLANAARQTEWQLLRNHRNPAYYERGMLLPRWDGGPLGGRSLLIHCADGFGDSLQHVRFVRHALADCARVTLDCPPALVRLFKVSFAGATIVSDRSALTDVHDTHACVLALSGFPALSRRPIPKPPYLFAESGSVGRRAHGPRRIGLCWRASDYSRMRCFPLEAAHPLRALGDIINLQKDVTPQEVLHLKVIGPLGRTTEPINDFLDVANLLATLDGLITVDTAVAHLAGAMNVPTVVVVCQPYAPFWRHRSIARTYYPSIALLCKPKGQPWGSFFANNIGRIERLLGTLRKLVSLG